MAGGRSSGTRGLEVEAGRQFRGAPPAVSLGFTGLAVRDWNQFHTCKLLRANYRVICVINLTSRTEANAAAVAHSLRDLLPGDRCRTIPWTSEALIAALPDIDLIINGTPLLAAAHAAGCPIKGLPMLLWQGVSSFEWWFHRPAPVEAVRAGLTAAVNRP